jgi:hypothetical protein
VSKLRFWPKVQFSPEKAQNRLPRRPLRCAPRARRNVSKGNACPGRVHHAQRPHLHLMNPCCPLAVCEARERSPPFCCGRPAPSSAPLPLSSLWCRCSPWTASGASWPPWPGRPRVARAKLRGVEDAGKPPGAFPLLHRRRRGVSRPEQKPPARSSVFGGQGPRVEI